MKNIDILFTSLLMGGIMWFTVHAQNDLVVFSNNGEKFYLYVNGVKQNANYETNIRVTNIQQPWVKVKVVFEDNKRIPDLTKTVQFVWGAEQKKGWEFVYQIVNKKGKYQLKPFSAAEISVQKSEGQAVLNYISEEPSTSNSTNVTHANGSPNANVSQTVTSTTVVTGGGTQNPSPNGCVGISFNVSPTGGNIQIHDGISGNVNSNTGYTTSVVSTTVVTNTSNSSGVSSTTTSSPANVSPKVEPSMSCAVTDTEFEQMKASIKAKAYEDSKLTMAKQITKSKCLKSSQVREIMKLFSYESTRLEFAKFAYNKVIDKDNYYLVNDAFQYETSIEELNESIGN